MTVLLYKEKGERTEYKNYRDISLLSVRYFIWAIILLTIDTLLIIGQ